MAPRDQVHHDVTVEVACQAGQERFADRHQVCIRTKNGGRELGGSCKPSVLTTTDALHTFRRGLPRHAKRTSQGRISLIDRTPDRLAVIARLALADFGSLCGRAVCTQIPALQWQRFGRGKRETSLWCECRGHRCWPGQPGGSLLILALTLSKQGRCARGRHAPRQ
jgi:hypothetical protein